MSRNWVFLSSGDRDLGVTFTVHPGSQALYAEVEATLELVLLCLLASTVREASGFSEAALAIIYLDFKSVSSWLPGVLMIKN